MSNDTFACKVWFFDEDEPEGDTVVGRPMYCVDAAEQFAEDNWGSCDYPHFMTVNVKDEFGKVHQFEVEVESQPTFSAYSVK